jgi:ferric-dicitrate binding protein FerR (iron transport regulator)
MTNPNPIPDPLKALIDGYLDGALDEAGTRELEQQLTADAAAREYFVRYARLNTDLHLEVRARRAGARALNRIEEITAGSKQQAAGSKRSIARSAVLYSLLTAACCLLAVGLSWRVWDPDWNSGASDPSIAWLVNAQNCQWQGGNPAGDLRAGRMLFLASGLAEVQFQCGARVVLEGPARLELLSDRSARLVSGKLTARVPGKRAGFEILSPHGKVIDLGTEFGVAVGQDGATDVYVFEGKVEALPSDAGPTGLANLAQNEAARIAAGRVTRQPADGLKGADQFVRAIVPPPVVTPRNFRLSFDRAIPETIADGAGQGIGLTHRLPGTGSRLPAADRNLRLDIEKAQLELTTTNSDINTQFRLGNGEYVGVRLEDLGFTGPEDFAVTTTIPNIPALESVGQFGLYVGSRSDKNIRGGLISRREPGEYTQFLVNNTDGNDTDINRVGLHSPGTDIRLTLKRTGGLYSLVTENRTSGSTTTLTVRHPDFLDADRDLFVGLFGANTQSNVRKTLIVKEFEATVWTVSRRAER